MFNVCQNGMLYFYKLPFMAEFTSMCPCFLIIIDLLFKNTYQLNLAVCLLDLQCSDNNEIAKKFKYIVTSVISVIFSEMLQFLWVHK